jgi:Sucrase/ferredoxin-like
VSPAAQLRCADAAELAADPPQASAPPADDWLLVEHQGPWGRHAITESRLDPVAASALARWASTNRARVTLIRRHGPLTREPRPRRWFRIDARPGSERVRGGWFSAERSLVDLLADPTAGAPHPEPIYLICTHGKHDTCCAVRGRAVAAALAAAYPERTWECTHVGGDRFAANLVLLPHGLYYGHVVAPVAADLVQRYDRGLLHPRLLRGRSSVPAPAQAAQHYARFALDDARIDSFGLLRMERLDPSTWKVRLRAPGSANDNDAHDPNNSDAVIVTVRARIIAADRPLTCADTTPGRFRVFDLVALRSEHLTTGGEGPPTRV